MKYFLIAGEASGDLHASQLMTALLKNDTNADFCYFGGEKMHRVGGTLIKHYKETAFMGFLSVIANLNKVLDNLQLCKNEILNQQPDALILVDYPSFNLKVAKFVKQELPNCKVYYFIPPKLWAWKEYRIKSIKKYVDKVLAILPFEVDFYSKHDYHVDYVGNPSREEVMEFQQQFDKSSFISSCGLSSNSIIGLLPGSRVAEIQSNLPIMLAACNEFNDYHIVIAAAPNIEESVYNEIIANAKLSRKVLILHNRSFEILSIASVALVVSGTATLEATLFDTPQIVCYKKAGGELVKQLYFKMLSIRFVSLVNIIAGKPVVKELLVNDMNVNRLSRELAELIHSDKTVQKMLDDYAYIRALLTEARCSTSAANIITSTLKN